MPSSCFGTEKDSQSTGSSAAKKVAPVRFVDERHAIRKVAAANDDDTPAARPHRPCAPGRLPANGETIPPHTET